MSEEFVRWVIYFDVVLLYALLATAFLSEKKARPHDDATRKRR